VTKKITLPTSRLPLKPKKLSRKLREWNKYIEKRIEAAKKSARLTAKDMKIIINV